MNNRYISLINNTVDFIEENIAEPITVESISLKSGYSIWQFQKIFKSFVGESIGQYLRHRRLTQAAIDLHNTDTKIIDIAVKYQFSSQESFSRSFKDYFNQTPNDVRKNSVVLVTKKKKSYTENHINFLEKGITLTPEIKKCGEMLLVGMVTTVVDVYADYQDFDQTLLPHWHNFLERSNEISLIKSQSYIGVLLRDEVNYEDQNYLASFEVSAFKNCPADMIEQRLEENEYAVFKIVGVGDIGSLAIDYIYGAWLPQSLYERGKGHEFVEFPSDYSVDNPQSVSFYHLPIVKR